MGSNAAEPGKGEVWVETQRCLVGGPRYRFYRSPDSILDTFLQRCRLDGARRKQRSALRYANRTKPESSNTSDAAVSDDISCWLKLTPKNRLIDTCFQILAR